MINELADEATRHFEAIPSGIERNTRIFDFISGAASKHVVKERYRFALEFLYLVADGKDANKYIAELETELNKLENKS
jgi:hypothetical protein